MTSDHGCAGMDFTSHPRPSRRLIRGLAAGGSPPRKADMRIRRLLNCRFYRQHPKMRAQLFKRTFGRMAFYRRALRARKAGFLGTLQALIAAFFVTKHAHRYTPLRAVVPDSVKPLGRPARPRRRVYRAGGRKLGGFQAALRHRFAQSALSRFGLDELTPEGKPSPETVRTMRNARKRERHLAR